MFLTGINIYIGRLSKARCIPECSWPASNPFNAGREKIKEEVALSSYFQAGK
jgi:hypothetical protein